jgi:hypothetical protein
MFGFYLTTNAQTNTFPASGYVGIGTTSPSAALSIFSNENYSNGWRNNLSLVSNDYPGVKFHPTNSNKVSFIGNNNDGGLYFGVNGSPTSTGSFSMVMTPNGNIGIGTSTPSATLSIFLIMYIVLDGKTT